MKTPIGLLGFSRPARAVCRRLVTISNAWSWPMTRWPRVLASVRIVATSSLTIRPTGMPVQSATTEATACSSTLGRTSGLSPCTAANVPCSSRRRATAAVRSPSDIAAAGAGASALPVASRNLARRLRISSTSSFSFFHATCSVPRRAVSLASDSFADFSRAAVSTPMAASRAMISNSVCRASMRR